VRTTDLERDEVTFTAPSSLSPRSELMSAFMGEIEFGALIILLPVGAALEIVALIPRDHVGSGQWTCGLVPARAGSSVAREWGA
jgi:hypothetical protein